MTPVRVLFVSSHARPGGSERYLELLLQGLGEDWVEAVVSLEDGPLVQRLREAGWAPVVLPTSRRAAGIARSARRLRRLLAAGRPSVVHANGIKAATVAALATLGTGVPVLWVKHDFARDRLLGRLVAWRCREIVAVSAAVAEPLGARLRRKVHVVHHGIPDVAVDRAEARRSLLGALGGPTPRAVVTLVGRLDPYKGHADVLAAAPAVLAAVPGVRFAFVGPDDPSHAGAHAALRRRAQELGVEADVAFLGYRADAAELLAASDLAVIPSRPGRGGLGREGFSYVALEALAVGTPVVAYADGALPEVLGRCGRLVTPGDPDALATALVELLRDAPARTALAECGRRRRAEHFELERSLAAMRERYVAASGDRARPGTPRAPGAVRGGGAH